MSKPKIADVFVFPTTKWYLEDDSTSRRIPSQGFATSYSNLKQLVISHRRGNDLEWTDSEIEDMIHRQVCEREPASYCQQWPGLEIAKGLVKEAGKFIASGMRFVPPEVEEQRKGICFQCQFWDKKGYGGMGKCRKCGCSKMIFKVASKKCPISLWGVWTSPK